MHNDMSLEKKKKKILIAHAVFEIIVLNEKSRYV